MQRLAASDDVGLPMRRIGLAIVLTVSLVLVPLAAGAQPAEKVSRVGILTLGHTTEIEQELRSLGYFEGKNILITRRYTHGHLEAVGRLATEIVDFRPDVVLVANGEMAGAILRASRTIPIVVAASSGLVAQGLVASLAKPGGNVTGLQIMSADLAGKRVELLHEIVPRLARLAVLVPSPPGRGFASERRETEVAARTLGVQSDVIWVQKRNDLYEAFKKVNRSRYDGLFVYSKQCTTLASAWLRHTLPPIWQRSKDLPEADVLSRLADWNARNQPPLPDAELQAVVRSAKANLEKLIRIWRS